VRVWQPMSQVASRLLQQAAHRRSGKVSPSCMQRRRGHADCRPVPLLTCCCRQTHTGQYIAAGAYQKFRTGWREIAALDKGKRVMMTGNIRQLKRMSGQHRRMKLHCRTDHLWRCSTRDVPVCRPYVHDFALCRASAHASTPEGMREQRNAGLPVHAGLFRRTRSAACVRRYQQQAGCEQLLASHMAV